ncbi:hypothetical protein K3495_g10336 [Podosphaera aphanis]|nr:hypothetical protein K3495_g10336 [Podosphaera aphanis]
MNTQASPPSQKRAPYLSREQRSQILTLYRDGSSHREIATRMGVTYNQVERTVQSGRASPKKRTGRPSKLMSAQVDELEAFVRRTRLTRHMSYLELSLEFNRWGVGEFAIRSALKKRGL